MKLLLAFLVPFVLAAQAAPKEKAAQAAPASPAVPKEKQAEAPVAPVALEPKTSGSVDLGYRWNSNVTGSLDTYRSIVNLGEGPRVLGFHYSLFEAPKKAWDRLDLSAAGWGGDPAAWFRVDASRL